MRIKTDAEEDKLVKIESPLTIERSKTTKGATVFFEAPPEPKPVTGTDLNDPARYGIPSAEDVFSNCYMIDGSDTYFLNAKVIGNGDAGILPGSGFHAESAIIAPKSVGLLWEDTQGTITSPRLSEGGTYLIFDTASAPGNAVIAAYDAEDQTGNILWSWHIWITEKPRDHPYKTPTGANTYLVMDRNLGALYAPATDTQAEMEAMTDAQRYAAYGLQYEWGRKDPFWGSAAVSGLKEKVVYGKVTTLKKVAYNATDDESGNNLLYAVRNPVTYILYNKASLSWNYTPNKALWGNPTGYEFLSKGRKTIYDPCPAGYMVSPGDLWSASDFLQAYVGKFKRGRMFRYDGTNITWYPAAGLRWEDNGAVGDVGIGGYYWSNSPFDAEGTGAQEYLFFASSSDIYPVNQYATASGHSIRCVRE